MTKNIIKYNINDNICAPCVKKDNNNNNFKTCYSKESLIKIAKLWNNENKDKPQIKIDNQTKKQLWTQIQKNLNMVCNKNDFCWKKQDFIKKIHDIDIEMYTFKPNYPKSWVKNEHTWLNTYDIYYVMKQYEKANKDFVFLGPIPSDCPIKIQCELSKLDLMEMKKKGINKIGIIYNLDTSNQSGSHWTAIYIDNKNNEVNYYDSYGSISTSLITKFIERITKQYIRNNINPIIIYNDKRHQYGGSECGMFSMNFILERLHGRTMYEISQVDIPDSKMTYLRKLLYNVKVHNIE
jgi:hypothetical protein